MITIQLDCQCEEKDGNEQEYTLPRKGFRVAPGQTFNCQDHTPMCACVYPGVCTHTHTIFK